MERTPRGWASPRRRAEVRERGFEVAFRERGARGVLIQDVGEDIELEGLLRDVVRLAEAPVLEERKVELPEQHRVRGAIHRPGRCQAALSRAVRWGTKDKPLYRAHLALAQMAAGKPPPTSDLQDTINQLAEAPCGQGYGRFVLGHLAYAAGEWAAAKRYLEAFLKRTTASRPALGIALEGEVRMTKATLAKMSAN
jgi:hypothetical protein